MKYNLTSIMKRAWEIKKENQDNIFAICLKMAWEEAKESGRKVRFKNHMTVVSPTDKFERELVRWTKGNFDRVYINGGSTRGDGYVDLKNRKAHLTSNYRVALEIADMILAMQF